MELRQIEYFVAVAESGSFSAAAASQNVTQPKISRYVRALEDELKSPLLLRDGRGAGLTETGRKLLSDSREILSIADRMKTNAANILGNPTGEVTVGLPPTVSSMIAMDLIEKIGEIYPGIEIITRTASSEHIEEWLGTSKLDIAVLIGAPKARNTLSQKLVDEKLCLVGCGMVSTASIDDVVRDRAVLMPSDLAGVSSLKTDDRFAGANVRSLGCLSTINECVRNGKALGILPMSNAKRLTRNSIGDSLKMIELEYTEELHLATSSCRGSSAIVRLAAQEISKIGRMSLRSEGATLR